MKKILILIPFLILFISTPLFSQGGDALIGLHNLSELGRMMQDDDDPEALSHLANLAKLDINDFSNQKLLSSAQILADLESLEVYSFGDYHLMRYNETQNEQRIQQIKQTITNNSSFILITFQIDENNGFLFDVDITNDSYTIEKRELYASLIQSEMISEASNTFDIAHIINEGVEFITSYLTHAQSSQFEYSEGQVSSDTKTDEPIDIKFSDYLVLSKSGKLFQLPDNVVEVRYSANYSPVNAVQKFILKEADNTTSEYRSLVFTNDNSKSAGYGKWSKDEEKWIRFPNKTNVTAYKKHLVILGYPYNTCGSYYTATREYIPTISSTDNDFLEGYISSNEEIESNIVALETVTLGNHIFYPLLNFPSPQGVEQQPCSQGRNISVSKFMSISNQTSPWQIQFNPFNYGGVFFNTELGDFYTYQYFPDDPNSVVTFIADYGSGTFIPYQLEVPYSANATIGDFLEENGLKGVHVTLDILGIVIDQIDLLNASLYLYEEDEKNAAISAAGAIPIVGIVSIGGKYCGKIITKIGKIRLVRLISIKVNGVRKILDFDIIGKLCEKHNIDKDLFAADYHHIAKLLADSPEKTVKAWEILHPGPHRLKVGALELFSDPAVLASRQKILDDAIDADYPNIPVEELTAIRHYTTNAYAELNAALRSSSPSDYFKSFEEILNDGLNKLPDYNGSTVHRGVKGAEADLAKTWSIGDDVNFKDFKSTSTSTNVANDFAGDVVYEIANPKGKAVCGVSCLPGESEVLFKSGSNFKVNNIQENFVVYDDDFNPFTVTKIFLEYVN